MTEENYCGAGSESIELSFLDDTCTVSRDELDHLQGDDECCIQYDEGDLKIFVGMGHIVTVYPSKQRKVDRIRIEKLILQED